MVRFIGINIVLHFFNYIGSLPWHAPIYLVANLIILNVSPQLGVVDRYCFIDLDGWVELEAVGPVEVDEVDIVLTPGLNVLFGYIVDVIVVVFHHCNIRLIKPKGVLSRQVVFISCSTHKHGDCIVCCVVYNAV